MLRSHVKRKIPGVENPCSSTLLTDAEGVFELSVHL